MEKILDAFDHGKELERPKLKVCPFCGGKAQVKFVDAKNLTAFKVKCSMCGSESNLYHIKWEIVTHDGFSKAFNQSIKECSDAWNTRVKKN